MTLSAVSDDSSGPSPGDCAPAAPPARYTPRSMARRTDPGEDGPGLALRIGTRIRAARLAAGLTQQQLAEGRYTKAYISALEQGHAKPSMAALDFIASRLGLPPSTFLGRDDRWDRLEADLLL